MVLSERQFAPAAKGWREIPNDIQTGMATQEKASGDGLLIFSRKKELKGPLVVFGYDYFADHAKTAGTVMPKLLSYVRLWGEGEEQAYEELNFADRKWMSQEIWDT